MALGATALGTVAACGGISEYHDDSAGQSGTGAHSGTSRTSGGSSSTSTGGSGGTTPETGPNASGGTLWTTGGGTTSTGSGASTASGGTTEGGSSSTSGGSATFGGSSGSGATGGTGTMGGTGAAGVGGTGGAGCGFDGNRVLLPSSTGWVDHLDVCNDVGVQGSWYAYGDQYGSDNGAKSCLTRGSHLPSECALVSTPDPTAFGFPNMDGNMHTAGVAERILPCVAGSLAATIPTSGCPGEGMAGGNDYSNMWGAGIGFDFNLEKTSPDSDGVRSTWDPLAYGVIGIAFTIVAAPPALRVEFPMALTAEEAAADFPPVTSLPPTTDEHSAGAPYWGAQAKGDGMFPNSPVVEGVNFVMWDAIGAPKAKAYTFDVSRMLGIRFHVPTAVSGSTRYDFTISNLTFLRHL